MVHEPSVVPKRQIVKKVTDKLLGDILHVNCFFAFKVQGILDTLNTEFVAIGLTVPGIIEILRPGVRCDVAQAIAKSPLH